MTVFLGRLHPGPGPLRALLAVGYGLCAWVLNDGFADPMWMWGLVALPMTGIAAEWCVRRTRWVAGTLLVALAWAGNFYTAAMATLATALVLGVRLLTAERMRAADRLRALGRAFAMAVCGILLAAPVLTVTFLASRAAQPAPEVSYRDRPPLLYQLAQLLPGGHGGVPTPNIFIGVLGLLLVAVFPFVRGVPPRVRIGWCALAAGVGASFVWEPHDLAVARLRAAQRQPLPGRVRAQRDPRDDLLARAGAPPAAWRTGRRMGRWSRCWRG